MRRGLLAILFLLVSAPAWAALAVDTASSTSSSGVGPFTFSHTVTGSETVLLVGIALYDSNDVVSGVTYNGVAMTAVPSSTVSNGQYTTTLYYLVAPASGANNVSVSVTGTVFEIGIGSISLTGADQATPLGTANTATGNSTTPSVNVTSASGEIVVDTSLIVHSGTYSVGGGQTSRWNAIGSGGFIKYAGSTEPGDTSVTMSWSNTSAQDWAISAVPVKPSGAGASGDALFFGIGL